MGGIAGIFRRDGLPADRSLIVRQSERLGDRGPDDGAVYVEGELGLAHRRSDAEGRGHQPHWDEENRIAVALDADLRGLGELAAKLRERGHRVREDHPADVVLAAFREWGDAFAERLEGAFAVVVLDRAERRLLLARDALGVRPLYFASNERRFAFSSELRALLADPGVARVLDPEAVAAWFDWGFVPEPQTLLRDVWVLSPGHVLVVDAEGTRARRFWQPAARAGSAEQLAADLRRALVEAAERAHEGAELVAMSGGRGSSALLAASPLPSLGLAGFDPDDRREALRFSSELSRPHAEMLDEATPITRARRSVAAVDTPIGDPWLLPQLALGSALRASGRVAGPVLSGHGYAEVGGNAAPLSRLPSPLTEGLARLEPAEPGTIARLSAHIFPILDRVAVEAQRPLRPAFVSKDTVELALALRGANVDAPVALPERVRLQPPRRSAGALAAWMRGPINQWMEELLFGRPGGSSGFFDAQRLRWWWYQHQLRLADRSPELWRAAVFEHWYRTEIEGERQDDAHRRRRRRRKTEPSLRGRPR